MTAKKSGLMLGNFQDPIGKKARIAFLASIPNIYFFPDKQAKNFRRDNGAVLFPPKKITVKLEAVIKKIENRKWCFVS